MGSIGDNHGFLWIDAPVGEGNVWNHSTYEANPVEWELGQRCHGHTCSVHGMKNYVKFSVH